MNSERKTDWLIGSVHPVVDSYTALFEEISEFVLTGRVQGIPDWEDEVSVLSVLSQSSLL